MSDTYSNPDSFSSELPVIQSIKLTGNNSYIINNAVVTTSKGTISLWIDPTTQCYEKFGVCMWIDNENLCDPRTVVDGVVGEIDFRGATVKSVDFSGIMRMCAYPTDPDHSTTAFDVKITVDLNSVEKTICMRAYNCHNGYYYHDFCAVDHDKRVRDRL